MPNHEQLSSLSLSDESCEYEKSFHHWQYLLRGNPEYRVAIQKEIEKIANERLNLPPYTNSPTDYLSHAPSPRTAAEMGLWFSLQNPGLSRDEFELRRYYFRLKSLFSGESPPDFEYVEEVDYSQKLRDDWEEARGLPPPGIDAYTWYGLYDDWGTIKK